MRATRITPHGIHLCKITCDIQKSIKIDSYTYDAIMSHSGKNFSDKLRNLVIDYLLLKREK